MFNNIYTDVDGVLLDWSNPFRKWLSEVHGIDLPEEIKEYNLDLLEELKFDNMVERFNQTVFSHDLPVWKDAKDVLLQLKTLYGLNIICVTSYCGDQTKRWDNLVDAFGVNMFGDVIFTKDKGKYLASVPHYNSVWVEDNVENYRMGDYFGMTSFLMNHPWNKQWIGKPILTKDTYNVVDGWKEIMDVIVNRNGSK